MMRYFWQTPDGTVHERLVQDGWLAWSYACGRDLGSGDELHDGPATCDGCCTEGAPEAVTSDTSPTDGWPEGYTIERSGAYYGVTAPDGSQVSSGTPSGKWRGKDAAQEAAWRHAQGG